MSLKPTLSFCLLYTSILAQDLSIVGRTGDTGTCPVLGLSLIHIFNAIAWHLKDNPKYDPNDPQVGLVHRIDKDTSGLLVVAKTPEDVYKRQIR